VLVESTDIEERLINNFVSLIRLSEVDVKEKTIQVEKGNYSLAPFDEGLVEAE
ncbi:pur operon repressor, partial [Bacillus anthracis]|nr:pur operon repressor [Bacillus anthracis]